jgi:hypothetical protein
MNENTNSPSYSNLFPLQAVPVIRGSVFDTSNRFWFAGGAGNATLPPAFTEVTDCGCHIMSDYAMPSCLAVCHEGMML